MGHALAGLKDTKRALQEIEQAIAIDPSSAPAWTALGAVQFVGGSREDAGAAFQKAVDVAPRAVEPRLALANYQWATGDVAGAEATLKHALSLDANTAAVHRSLALMYLTTRRVAEAEPHFRALADQDPGARLNLADYYVGRTKAHDVHTQTERRRLSDQAGDAAPTSPGEDSQRNRNRQSTIPQSAMFTRL